MNGWSLFERSPLASLFASFISQLRKGEGGMLRTGRAFRVALVVCCALTAAALLWRSATVSTQQLGAPFSLGPAESLIFEAVKAIRSGMNPYDLYDRAPFLFTMYTPLYPYLVAPLPMPDENPLFWGRLVAMIAMLASSGLFFLVAPGRRVIVPLAAFCVFHSLWPITERMAFYRVDSLGLLLSGLAVVSTQRAQRHAKWGSIAAVFCVLAVLSKQSFLAAPIACTVYLFFRNRPAFRHLVTTGLLLSGIFLLAAHFFWGAGFWYSTLSGPRQLISLSQVLAVSTAVMRQPMVIAIAALGSLLFILAWKKRGRALLIDSPYLIYVIAATSILVATVGKTGSGSNYFFEPILAISLWVIWELSRAESPLPQKGLASVGAALLVIGVIDLSTSQPVNYATIEKPQLTHRATDVSTIRKTIESLGVNHPSVVRLDRHPWLIRESDRVFLSSPILYRLLWVDGVLSPDSFLNSLKAKEIDVIMAPRIFRRRAPLPEPFESIMKSVKAGYQIGATTSRFDYYVPKEFSPSKKVRRKSGTHRASP